MKVLNKKKARVILLAGIGLAIFAFARADEKPAVGTAPATVAVKAKADASGSAEAMMKKSDCFTCHAIKRKVVGPAYKDVAKKYKGDKSAVATLVKKVKEGGSGNWGQIPMAAHPDLKDEDAKAMVQWVLKQK